MANPFINAMRPMMQQQGRRAMPRNDMIRPMVQQSQPQGNQIMGMGGTPRPMMQGAQGGRGMPRGDILRPSPMPSNPRPRLGGIMGGGGQGGPMTFEEIMMQSGGQQRMDMQNQMNSVGAMDPRMLEMILSQMNPGMRRPQRMG